MLKVKRVYDPPTTRDGKRILVDRLWPRGLEKEKAAVDEWLKDIAPSSELRKWFGHDPLKWAEFKKRYRRELSGKEELLNRLREESERETVTLIYSAKDATHNNAVALCEILKSQSGRGIFT